MAVKYFYPTQDATIYFVSSSNTECLRNTGMDAILEVNKESNISYSRTLIKFNTNDISTYISDNSFHLNGTNSVAKLKMFNATAQELSADYIIDVFPVSQSWDNGLGKYNYIPAETGSVNWFYRKTGLLWDTLNSGGGTYHTTPTGSISKSLFDNTDLNIDVTEIVTSWISGSISNEGVIIKRSATEESNTYNLGKLSYFSKETNTIYQPRIEIYSNDKVYSITDSSSLQHYTGSNQIVIKPLNLQNVYRYDETPRINFYVREKYPRVNYVTSYSSTDAYSTIYRLPSSSSYSLKDLVTGEIIVDYDYNYSAINHNDAGSYIDFDMTNLQPDRIYTFTFKYKDVNDKTRTYIKEDDFIFKVIKNDKDF